MRKRFSGRRLRELRQQRELSREQYSVMAEISHHTLCLYEQGHRAPRFATGVRLADVLRVPPHELLEDDVEGSLR